VADAQKMTPIACVQNLYNLANRQDEALVDQLAAQGIPYVPFFPLGGFSPLQSEQLTAVAEELNATTLQVALAWLLQRSPNILLIPGTSSPEHLQQNLASGDLVLSADVVQRLNGIA
jgi:Predicted oxidoreductases (related to aryl-alcohol dehydrogenases)